MAQRDAFKPGCRERIFPFPTITGVSSYFPKEACTIKYTNRYPWLTAALLLAITHTKQICRQRESNN